MQKSRHKKQSFLRDHSQYQRHLFSVIVFRVSFKNAHRKEKSFHKLYPQKKLK